MPAQSALASERHVWASTQGQARSARPFLYKQVLGLERPWLDEVVSAKAKAARRGACRLCCAS